MTVHVTAPMLAAFNHFLNAGFIENGAGAAVGNFCQESGEMLIATMFREHPDASGGVPEALKSGGIAEWLGDRKIAYIAFSGRAETRLGIAKGSLLNDLGTQCDFVVYELQTTVDSIGRLIYGELYKQLTSGSRSIANLTANFMMVYERPRLGPTANLDNRIAHAEAVVERARLLRVPTAPQPAPSVPVPPAPGPMVPPTPLPIPPPVSVPGLPPISASSTGRRVAEYNHIKTALDELLAERAALEEEIGEFQDMLSRIGRKIPAGTIPAIQPTKQQGMTTMFGADWKTTFSGVVAALAGAAHVIPQLKPYADILTAIMGVSIGTLGIAAQDAK